MKLRNTFLFSIILFLIILSNQKIIAQTPGVIYKKTVPLNNILDINGDGYVSQDTLGFISNDLSESEINYVPIPVLESEPDSDPISGPNCSYNDIVESGSKDPVMIYFDGTNLLFRFRLSGTAANAKGYSILVDSDEKFGFYGNEADPDAVIGNPGFEFEIVLETEKGVGLYDVNGKNFAIEKSAPTARPYSTHAQKSIAFTTTCGNPDYFYDFYVPLSDLSTNFGITSNTLLRFAGATVMNDTTFIGSKEGSDIGGSDEFYFGDIFDCIPPIKISEINSANTDCRTFCPSINSIAEGATTVSGTSLEQDGTIIEIFVNGSSVGTTIVSGSSWSLSVAALNSGDEVKATAKDGSKYVSFDDCDIQIVDCSPVLNINSHNNNRLCGDGYISSAVFRIYHNGTEIFLGGDSLFTDLGSGNWVYACDGSTACSSGTSCMENGWYDVTQDLAGCESKCVGVGFGGGSSIPVINTPVKTDTDPITGTGVNGSIIILYQDSLIIGTDTVSGGVWSISPIVSLKACSEITARQVETNKKGSALTTPVTVFSTTTYHKPEITGKYCIFTGDVVSTVTGTSVEEENSEIEVFVNSSSAGTTFVTANGTWELTGLSINIGDSVTAQVINGSYCFSESELSDTVIVSPKAHNTAFISGTYFEGANSVSGTGTDNRIVNLYQDGILIGQNIILGGWNISGLNSNPDTKLYAGGLLTVTETVADSCESDFSFPPDTVQCISPSIKTLTAVQSEYCKDENAEVIVGSSENDVLYTPVSVFDGSQIGYSRIGDGNDLTLTTYVLTNDTGITVKAEKLSDISCESHTDSVFIQINPVPDSTLTVSPANSSICRYDSLDITITGAEAGVTYQLQNAADSNNIGSPALGDGTNPLIISTGPLDADITIKVNAVDYSLPTNCSVDLVNTVHVTVTGANNTQNVTVDDPILCQNNPTNINVTSDNDGYSYQVKNSSGSNVGSVFTGDGNIYSVSTGNLTVTDTFYVEVDDGSGCIIRVLDEEPVTVLACNRDIFLEKTVDDSTPDEGQTITYTVNVTNKDVVDDVTNLVVTDVLPVGLTFVNATPSTGTWSAPDWTIGSLSSGANATLTIDATVNPGTSADTITNIISNTQYETDDNTTSDIDSIDIFVNNEADIVLTKTVDDTTPDEGQTITFIVTVTNNGPAQATNLVINDVLPAGLSFINVTPSAGNWTSPNWTIGTLNNGGTETLTITATVDAGTSNDLITNTVSNTQDQIDNNSTIDDNNESVTVNNDADIVLSKTVDDTTPDEGQTITFTVTVTNNGPAQATNLVINDVLPAGLSFINATPSAGNWTSPNWTIGTLNNGGTETLTITATVDAGTGGTTITNTISNAQDQIDINTTLDDNNESVTVNNDADIVLLKTVDDGTPDEGQIITFTVTVTNNGPAQAKNLVINDVLPSGLSLVSATPITGTWTDPNWTVGTLDNGVSASLIIVATVDVGTGGSTITNTITNTQDQTDVNTTLDDNNESVIVNNDADIVLTKTVDNSTPNEGENVSFTITVTNNGPAQAKNLTITDNLPAGLTFVSATPTAGTWTAPDWSVGTLNNGATETIIITATVDAGTGGSTITNIISNTQDQSDLNSTPDDNDEDIAVNNDADIVLTKVADDTTPEEGQTVTYTVTVMNNGPTQVSNLVVTDILPAGLTFVSATPTAGTWSSPDWTVGTLNNGASETLTIEVIVDIGTGGNTMTNTISNTQNQIDNNNTTDDNFEDIIVSNDADIVLTKTVDNISPNSGDDITFTITVTNNGPAQLHNLVVTDVLPAGLSFVSATPTAGNWTSPDWSIGILNNSATENIIIVANVDAGTNGFDITNNISNSQDQNDTNSTNDDDFEIIYVNDIPVANDDFETIDEDNILTSDVLINDTGLSDGGIIVSVITGTVNGILELNTDGTYTYTPDADYHGSDSFVYEVCDTENDCNQATVNITINSVNDLPIAEDDTISIPEDSELNEIFILNDNGNGADYFGGDGPGTGAVGLISSTVNGSLVFNDNGTPDDPTDDYFIYTPAHDYFGDDIFEYEICDVDGDCDQAYVTIKVINDNVLFFPKIFTPNSNGFNDLFYIEGLEIYPENSIKIFNRWGNKVFEASPYHNNWDGKANFGIKIEGNELPEGTYFYILKTGNEAKDIKGYIYLKR